MSDGLSDLDGFFSPRLPRDGTPPEAHKLGMVVGGSLSLFFLCIDLVFDIGNPNKAYNQAQEGGENRGSPAKEKEDVGTPVEPEGGREHGKNRKGNKHNTNNKCNHQILRKDPEVQ